MFSFERRCAMRREFIVGAALLCTAVATGLVLCASGHALASALVSASAQGPVDGSDKASMLHGAELTALGDCATCHTAPGGCIGRRSSRDGCLFVVAASRRADHIVTRVVARIVALRGRAG